MFGIILVGIAAFLDFFDGFVARALGVSGELGKQLDSLADVVSFGVAPAVGLMSAYGAIICGFLDQPGFADGVLRCSFGQPLEVYIPLAIALFSALRLAKFNIDTRQTDRFIGLPTPANSMLILSVVWALTQEEFPFEFGYMQLTIFISLLTAISCYLLVAEMPLLALKFKTFGWKGNEARFILILGSIGIILWLGVSGLAIVVLLYLLISIIDNRIHRHEVSR